MLFVQIFLAAAASVSVSALPSLFDAGLPAHVNALAFRQTNETTTTGGIDLNGDVLSSLNMTDAQRAEADQCYGLCMPDVISGDLISKCGQKTPQIQVAACICRDQTAINAIEACHTKCIPSNVTLPVESHAPARCARIIEQAGDSAASVRIGGLALAVAAFAFTALL